MDLDTQNTHTQTLTQEDGKQIPITIECIQKDAMTRYFQLWKETTAQQEAFQKQLITRDQRIKDAFDHVNQTITTLISDLEKRKLINNYNEKEKQQLQHMIEDREDADGDLYSKVGEIDGRLVRVETDLQNVIEMAADTARKYDRMFWLLLGFFIIFMVKTIVFGI